MSDFDQLLLSNSKSKSMKWICRRTCWKTPWDINKNHFGPGGIAGSEWMHTVSAVSDTPVADCSAPRVNITCRVAYCFSPAISPFHLALSVSYSKLTLSRCGQLWQYVGMGLLLTPLHRDCNANGETAQISPCVPSTVSSRRVGRRWDSMILTSHEDRWNLGTSEWDQ